MITKSKFWQKIVSELKNIDRSKKITKNVMQIIKDHPQDESKSKEKAT
mgnify:FL=1|tara:strand:+ start:440 stop:583 length:144 start_codon:yes stop_codon:yes gene_type:complete